MIARLRELMERASLAWDILCARDTPLVAHVRSEVARVDESVAMNCANIARVFSLEGHSGGSAPIVIPWIAKALAWEPIAPLLGDDDEWRDVSKHMGRPVLQNKRCSRVFREADDSVYDVCGKVFREPNGAAYTNSESRVPVVFPYHPRTEVVNVPA